MKPTHLRVCDDAPDLEAMLTETFERVRVMYREAATAIVVLGGSDSMIKSIADAQAANEAMLSTLRHPAGGK